MTYIIIRFIYSLYMFIHSAAIFHLHFCSIMHWCTDGAALPISWCARSHDDNKGFDFDLKLATSKLAIDVAASTSWVKRLCELPFLFETRLLITWLHMTKDLSKCLPVLLAAKMKANSACSPFILQVHYDNAAVRRHRGWSHYLFDGGTGQYSPAVGCITVCRRTC